LRLHHHQVEEKTEKSDGAHSFGGMLRDHQNTFQEYGGYGGFGRGLTGEGSGVGSSRPSRGLGYAGQDIATSGQGSSSRNPRRFGGDEDY